MDAITIAIISAAVLAALVLALIPMLMTVTDQETEEILNRMEKRIKGTKVVDYT